MQAKRACAHGGRSHTYLCIYIYIYGWLYHIYARAAAAAAAHVHCVRSSDRRVYIRRGRAHVRLHAHGELTCCGHRGERKQCATAMHTCVICIYIYMFIYIYTYLM